MNSTDPSSHLPDSDARAHQVLNLQVVIKFRLLVVWQAFRFLSKNQVGHSSIGFLRRPESNHILRAGGRNELDYFVVGFVWLHGLNLGMGFITATARLRTPLVQALT